jgi:D-beta-D-heptose 7-phosphate kinase/D-beta-D-heptose 1-phosphate adenosyltransferase
MKKKSQAKSVRKKEVWVAVSGGFDPIHIGHVRMFQKAKKRGTKLLVLLNNDAWLRAKKGFAFMPEKERAEIIRALGADRVYITKHKENDPDRSVCNALRATRPDIFANGGDRGKGTVPEVDVCNELGIRMIFNVGHGGKVQSSSWLTDAVRKKTEEKRV